MAQDLHNKFLVKAHPLSVADPDANYTTDSLIEIEIATIQVSTDQDYAPDTTGTTQVKILVMDTESILAILAAPTAGGTGYKVGDILKVSEGTSGTVKVTTIDSGTGEATAVSLITGGVNYTTGSGKATTGGTGTGCTIEITHAAEFVEETALLVDIANKNETHRRILPEFAGRHIRCDVTKGNATAGTLAIHFLGKRKVR